jgi:hypothetical protein
MLYTECPKMYKVECLLDRFYDFWYIDISTLKHRVLIFYFLGGHQYAVD